MTTTIQIHNMAADLRDSAESMWAAMAPGPFTEGQLQRLSRCMDLAEAAMDAIRAGHDAEAEENLAAASEQHHKAIRWATGLDR